MLQPMMQLYLVKLSLRAADSSRTLYRKCYVVCAVGYARSKSKIVSIVEAAPLMIACDRSNIYASFTGLKIQ
jgi:hypothetical protein